MKKGLLLVILLWYATPSFPQFFKGGIMPALNFSQITGDNMLGYNKGGLLLGTFVEHDINDLITLRMELNYSMKGSRRIINEFNTTPGEWDLYRVNYLEIPLTIDHVIYNKFGLSGGLAFGINVGEYYIDRYGTEDPHFSMAKKWESSILLGAYYEYNERFEFFVRHESSILNFTTSGNTPFWQVWGIVKRGYINVLLSFGARYYLGVKM